MQLTGALVVVHESHLWLFFIGVNGSLLNKKRLIGIKWNIIYVINSILLGAFFEKDLEFLSSFSCFNCFRLQCL